MSTKLILPKLFKPDQGVNNDDKVRIGFQNIGYLNSLCCVFYIGKNVGKKLGFSKNDRFGLEIDEFNPKIWRLIKHPKGWKIGLRGTIFRLQVSWLDTVPKGYSSSLTYVHYDINGGNLEINLKDYDTEKLLNE
jgi:hypothetical protein